MSNVAINVEHLSKAYRIGLEEETNDTLASAFVSLAKSPIRNFRKLQRLNTFDFNEPSEDIIWALRDISFDVNEGEVLGIIGRNGAGKSTLLKVFSRITEPTLGRVVMRGRVASLLEVGTGFHPDMTGRDNIYMNATILGMRKKEVDENYDRIVEFSGVEKFINTPIKRYSSGMKVRLAFSVAAHLEPEVLVIDEVLAVGDAEFQQRCLGKMGEVAQSGRTVLFVSHQMEAVQRLCTRCIWIEHGEVRADGVPEAVVREYLSSRGRAVRRPTYASENGHEREAVELVHASVLGSTGQEVSDICYGEPLSVQMRWDCSADQPGAYYYVRVTDAQGRRLFTVNTRGSVEPKAGLTELRCTFDHNVLLPGSYTVTIGCFRAPKEFLFEVEDALNFSVLEVPHEGVESSLAVRSIFDPRPAWRQMPATPQVEAQRS